MWSLFKKKGEEKEEGLLNYTNNGEKLPPLKFSNNKTQEDIVNEILSEINKGVKIIFLRGVCGSGKSVIALELAKHFDKTSIVVPIKSLQEQYEKDYTQDKFILKENGQKLKISLIKGRNNFLCPFMGGSADDKELPCTIEIREKNMEQIKKYIEKNPFANKYDFSSVFDVKRMSIAPACPYWSPLLPSDISVKSLEKANKFKYDAISGKTYALHQRKKGCKYYDQYEAYANSDVLIFNAQKYILETLMGRKPKTKLDVIDECDDFLDSFAEEKKINLNRMLSALMNVIPDNIEKKNAIKEMVLEVNKMIYDVDCETEKITNTDFYDFFQEILKQPYLAEDEEYNYYNAVFEIAKNFEPFLEDSYVSTSKQKDANGNEVKYISIVTINLDKQFQQLLKATESMVLMSGTLHSEQVLKDIFGLTNFKIIEAETKTPGTIIKFRTGLEKNCKYENFKCKHTTREDYLKALNQCVESAKLPLLVHVNSFEDLPTELERAIYKMDLVVSREKLKEIQEKDKSNNEVAKFKSGETKILFTTKCSRGMDFPGEKCNSIILTKYPYPNTQELFWKILKKEKPNKFMEFYLDKADRELHQKIYRGLRFKDDHIILLSPDSRVLDAWLS